MGQRERVRHLLPIADARGVFLGFPGLRPGLPANLVTYRRDPRDDPAVLARPAAVFVAGRRVAQGR